MKKRILCVCYGGGHVPVIIPLAKKMMEKYTVMVLGLTIARVHLEKEGIPCFSFRDLPISNKAIDYGEELASEVEVHPLVPKEETVAYMGLSYESLVDEHGEKKAKLLYEQVGRAAFLPVALMEKIIQEGNYDLVIATNTPRSERAAIIAAGRLDVPSICINPLFAADELDWLSKPGHANKICVLANFVCERLIKAGRPRNEIVVTGNPAFDSLAELRNSKARKIQRERRGWGEHEKVLLWASNAEPIIDPWTKEKRVSNLLDKIEMELGDILKKNGNYRVVVRPHPSDTRRPSMASERMELSDYDDDISELLAAVDCVIVLASTTGLQAALIGKPVINIKLSAYSHLVPYDKMGLSIGVDNIFDLHDAVSEALENGQQGESNLPECGRATAMIEHEVEMLLEG